MALDPEPAADIGRDAAHPRLGKAQHMRRLAPHPVHDLGRRPDRHRIGAAVVFGDDAPAFHRHRGVAVMDKAAFQAMRRGGERGLDIAFADRELADLVAAEVLVKQHGVGRDRALRVDDRGQRVEVERDEFGGVLGGVAAVGDDDGDRLADKPHLVVGEQWLGRD